MQPQNGLRFPPLRGIVLDGSTFASGGADGTRLRNLAIISTQAVVSQNDKGLGVQRHQLDTEFDIWSKLGPTVFQGTCVIKNGGSAVGAQTDYTNEGATRGGELVMFRCTTAGIRGGAPPNAFAMVGLNKIGSQIPATATNGVDEVDGGAEWTVESIPKDYKNDEPYVVGQRVVLPGDPDHVFECTGAGTSLGQATTIAAGATLPQATITVADTSDLPSAGTIRVRTSDGLRTLSYLGKTPTTFTECTGGTGTISIGATVTPLNFAAYGIPVRIAPNFMGPVYCDEFYDRTTTVTEDSDKAELSKVMTINVEEYRRLCR